MGQGAAEAPPQELCGTNSKTRNAINRVVRKYLPGNRFRSTPSPEGSDQMSNQTQLLMCVQDIGPSEPKRDSTGREQSPLPQQKLRGMGQQTAERNPQPMPLRTRLINMGPG
jgi:hypothetical protein